MENKPKPPCYLCGRPSNIKCCKKGYDWCHDCHTTWQALNYEDILDSMSGYAFDHHGYARKMREINGTKESEHVELIMTQHTMKSWPHFFQAIKAGKKKHDLRMKNEREFKVGDHVLLQEYDPVTGKYTGEELECIITYITSNDFPCAYSSSMLDRNAVILSLEPIY